MTCTHKPANAIEVVGFRQTVHVDGMQMTVRCYLMDKPNLHYEVFVHGLGETCIVDIPCQQESRIGQLIADIVICFAASLQIRTPTLS